MSSLIGCIVAADARALIRFLNRVVKNPVCRPAKKVPDAGRARNRRAKVVIEPLQPEGSQILERNRVALEALDRLLAEPEDLTSEMLMELEKIIEEHPLRI